MRYVGRYRDTGRCRVLPNLGDVLVPGNSRIFLRPEMRGWILIRDDGTRISHATMKMGNCTVRGLMYGAVILRMDRERGIKDTFRNWFQLYRSNQNGFFALGRI